MKYVGARTVDQPAQAQAVAWRDQWPHWNCSLAYQPELTYVITRGKVRNDLNSTLLEHHNFVINHSVLTGR
jgi:hypothetical protein